MCASVYAVIEEIRDLQRDKRRSAEDLRRDFDRAVAAFESFLQSLERTLDEPPSLPAPNQKLIVLHGPSYYD